MEIVINVYFRCFLQLMLAENVLILFTFAGTQKIRLLVKQQFTKYINERSQTK